MKIRLRWLSRPGLPNSKLIATTTVNSNQGLINKKARRLPSKVSECLTEQQSNADAMRHNNLFYYLNISTQILLSNLFNLLFKLK